ncbi:MAG: ArnT family glycosyltransferase [Vicinamibacterales bacterium]
MRTAAGAPAPEAPYPVSDTFRATPRLELAAVTLAVSAGAVLRFWSLGHGIPYAVGADEPEIVLRAVRMMKTGDFNPHFFDYPGLYIYMQLAVACARFLFGAMQGAWRSLDQVGPEQFYLWGRALTASLGTATVALVYLIGRRWGRPQALAAASLMAVMPLHVRESHYVLTDVPMTFFVASAFLLALRAAERTTVAGFAWAGVAAGLAAATKYYGGLIVSAPVVLALATDRRSARPAAAAAAAIAAAIAAFLLAAPYTVMDLPAFLNGFASMSPALAGRDLSEDPGWLIYMKHLRLSLGWPASAALIVGLAVAVRQAIRGPERARWAVLALFPSVYFWLLSSRTLIFGRYLMPIMPFVALIAGIAVVSVFQLLRDLASRAKDGRLRRRPLRAALAAALVLPVLLPPTLTSCSFNRRLGLTSTYALAYEWILANVPRSAKVAIETAGLRLPTDRYDVEQMKTLILRDYEAFRAGGFDYFIASSQSFGSALEAPHLRPKHYEAYRRLFETASLVQKIVPSTDHPGPELRIYRVEQ